MLVLRLALLSVQHVICAKTLCNSSRLDIKLVRRREVEGREFFECLTAYRERSLFRIGHGVIHYGLLISIS